MATAASPQQKKSRLSAPSQTSIKWIKALVFCLCLLPFVRLAYGIATQNLGANPIEFITRNTGDWTLIFLCITLTVTPARRLSQWNWLLRLRRMFGLYSFFYALLHFTTFIWFDHFFDLAAIWKDVLKRPFITVGFIAFCLLIPLAVTSTNAMVKRLGAKHWQALHRTVYLIAMLAILHFWWMKAGKHDFVKPIYYGSIIGVLLLYRVVYWLRNRTS